MMKAVITFSSQVSLWMRAPVTSLVEYCPSFSLSLVEENNFRFVTSNQQTHMPSPCNGQQPIEEAVLIPQYLRTRFQKEFLQWRQSTKAKH